jgi:tetratricopeptide (TPR) repeat protein
MIGKILRLVKEDQEMVQRIFPRLKQRLLVLFSAWILVCAVSPEPGQIQAAQGLFKDGLYELAAGEYRAYLLRFPGGEYEEEALFYEGRCLYELGDFEESLSYFKKASEKRGPHRADALYFFGESAYLVRHLEKSENAFSELIQEFPDSGRSTDARKRLGQVSYLLGNRLFSRGVYSQALERYEKAVAFEPKLSSLAGYHGAQTLARMGRPEEAGAEWARLAEDKENSGPPDPTDTELARLSRFALAVVLEQSGNTKEAVKEYEKFLADIPDSSDAHEHLSYLSLELRAEAEKGVVRALSAQGQDEKAVKYWRDCQTGKRLEQRYARYEAAWEHYLLRENKELKDALEALVNSRDMDEVRILSYRLLSRMEREDGRIQAALELLLRMLREFEGSPELVAEAGDAARLEMAELDFLLGNWIEAQEFLRAISQGAEKWTRARASYLEAEIYYKQGEHEKALSGFSEYLEQYPGGRDVALAFLRRGELRAQRGDDAGAVQDLLEVKARGGRGMTLLRAYELIADSYRRQGLLDSALQAAEDQKVLAARLPTAEEDARAEQARLYFCKGDYAKGIEVYQALVRDTDTDAHRSAGYLFEQGWGFYRLADPEQARPIFDQLASSDSDWAVPAGLMLARIREADGDMDGAMASLDQLHTSDPELGARLLYASGKKRELAGEPAKAIEYYQALERDYPSALIEVRGPIQRCFLGLEDFSAWLSYVPGLSEGSGGEQSPSDRLSEDQIRLRLLSAYERADTKEFQAWKDALEVVAVHEEALEEARLLWARIQLMQGDQVSALNELEELSRNSPLSPFRDAIAFFLAGQAFKNKRCGEVLKRLEGMVPEHLSRDEEAWVHHMRGTCYERLGDTSGMAEEYLSLIQDYPEVVHFPTQHLRVGTSLLEAGEYKDALKSLRQALVEVRDEASAAEAQYWIGECYRRLGQYEAAAVEYLRVSYLYPDQTAWSVTATYQAALVLQSLGQYEESAVLLARVVKAAEGTRQGEFAQKKLDELKEHLGK